ALKIGKATTIIPMTEINNIPHHYFNFVPYNDLTARVYHDKILTDYIGIIKTVHGDHKQPDSIIRLDVANQSGEQIQITLWPEIASLVDIEALTNKKQHVVAAISSLRVSEFKGKIQMASTSATRVHTDPDINIAKTILASYTAQEDTNTPTNTYDLPLQTIIDPSTHNRTTIAALLQRIPSEIVNIKFTCEATITTFNTERTWYYMGCKACKRKMDEKEGSYICANDGELQPKHLYCITATIADETSSTAVTIFDQAAKTLIGISCFDMVVQQGYTEPTIIPPAILSLIGQPKIFQLQQPRDHNIGRKRFNVNRVFINNSNTTAADPELGPRAATKRQLFVDPAQESAIIKHHKNNDFD
ncbi:hypothetical protein R6Q59_030722, partial [Mikania micrantha]